MTSENLKKLQGLFRELFQLDMSDLDFGLYRLFNIKRREIEDFLTRQLPEEVDEKFHILTERDKADHREWLEKLEEQIRENLPPDTLLPNGDARSTYRDAPLVKRYLDQKVRLERIQASEEQKADVFNHLFNFFSRYYDEGDFIPKRFYGSRANYAVPYNGEEVFFHWANKDQHYIKTGENFRDYTFKIEGLGTEYRIRFVLSHATTPRGNTKGEYRYFFPQPEQINFNKETHTIILPFEYRLLRWVTEHQAWEPWILYMLDAIEETALYTRDKILAIRNLLAETLEFTKENLPSRVYSKDLIELLFHQPYTKANFLVDEGIAERKTAANYLKQLEKIGILQVQKVGKENLYLNKELFEVLSQ